MDVETFGKRLIKEISDHPGGHAYILASNLIAAIQLALDPGGDEGQQFPRMLYRGLAGEEERTRIVVNEKELHEALDEGWNRQPASLPAGFPINKIEADRRRSDYRRCLIRTPAELKLFEENIDPDDWTEDSAYALAHSFSFYF